MYSLRQNHSVGTKIIDHLTVTFDLHFENFNLAHNFWTVRGRDFIFHMCIPCDKTFPLVPNLLTAWPSVTFDLHFDLSICIKFFDFVTMTGFLPTYENLILDHNFFTVKGRAYIFHMCSPCDMTFLSVPKNYPFYLDCNLGPWYCQPGASMFHKHILFHNRFWLG